VRRRRRNEYGESNKRSGFWRGPGSAQQNTLRGVPFNLSRVFITKQTVLPCLIYIVKKQKAAKSRTVAAFQGDA
jgi:hypothetical protein